ncbi:M15 family metallopeptidase [Porphyromonas somerae]|uniref:M15 family metallopeptidase n=1 Tax=Porphyromonas somerae TaxID=322095 RepID=UPI002A7644E9|nr:M15 family metallopeptidase [Porphyromonas somerae]MDY3120076.1 M15 family metallopeptidase [Porphyromonas somerae]MDY3885251.1 M15 family metallopeptidase [Porphyromonas somerae]
MSQIKILKEVLKYLIVLQYLFSFTPSSAGDSIVGLVDIQQVDPTIQVELMYASTDNFVGVDMYGEWTTAYLLPHIAEKLKQVQARLKKDWGEEYSLLICDAARPLSVQKKMYNTVRGTKYQGYVASPANGGGRHNYGAAVDLTIINTQTGERVDMGSPVDHFGIRSHTDKEEELLRKGLISKEAYNHRRYLTKQMNAVGLRNIRKEWWHFEERISIKEVRSRYRLIQ